MIYILDPGHNYSDTWQKFSPKREDGTRFYEYQSNRKIAVKTAEKLEKLGIKYYWSVKPTDQRDASLQKRVDVANAVCRGEGTKNCFFISFHSNALGNGSEWFDNARGWSVYTSPGKTKSDEYATIMFEEASKVLPQYGMTLRKDMSDGDPDYEENFYVLKNTLCPAVLIEALFYTSRKDLEFLESEQGVEVLSDIVVNTILRIEEHNVPRA